MATPAISRFEADPTIVLHFTNAYEDGDEIVLDGFFEGDPSPPHTGGTKWDKLFRILALDRLQVRLHRWRFNPTQSPNSAPSIPTTRQIPTAIAGTHFQRYALDMTPGSQLRRWGTADSTATDCDERRAPLGLRP